MNIQNLNFYIPKTNKLSFAQQNPTKFRGKEQDKDSVEISSSLNYRRVLLNLENDLEFHNSRILEYEKAVQNFSQDMPILQKIAEDLKIDDEDAKSILSHSYGRRKESFNALYDEINKVLSSKIEGFTLSNSTMLDLVYAVRKAFYLERYFDNHGQIITNQIKKIAFNILENMKPEYDRSLYLLNKSKKSAMQIQKSIEHIKLDSKAHVLYDDSLTVAKQGEMFEGLKKNGCLIDLEDEKYANFSQISKDALFAELDKTHFAAKKRIINNQANRDFLSQIEECCVITPFELENWYQIEDFRGIFSKYREMSVGQKRLLFFDSNTPDFKAIESVLKGEVATVEALGKTKQSDLSNLPFVFKKFTLSDDFKKIDYTFVDLNEDINNKILNSNQRYRKLLAQLPYKRTKTPWGSIIEMNNPYNRKLVENTCLIYPEKSEYFYDSLGGANPVKIDIPVEYLEYLGFSKANILIDLIKNGKLDGFQKPDGTYFVKVDTKNDLTKNKNLAALHTLRKQNPYIKTFKEVSAALGIKQNRLELAIFNGEFEIIDEYISTADRDVRYINIATSKNQEFIKKVKFEQELEKELKETQRKEQRKAKIQNQDIRQRMSGVRMALIWEFMPNTKAVGSMLVKRDGYISKLLAKDEDPEQVLTDLEEARLNAYRKEIWLIAGVDELKEAHKKAGMIMKIFKEQGLGAVDEQYLPIFERYGFILA